MYIYVFVVPKQKSCHLFLIFHVKKKKLKTKTIIKEPSWTIKDNVLQEDKWDKVNDMY